MATQNIIRTLSCLFLFLLIGCESVFFDEEPSIDPQSIYEQTWSFVDQEYSFFEYKNINWDSIGSVYAQKISNDLSDEQLFDTLASMLFVLRDGHVNLKADFDRSRNWTWYLNAPENYYYSVLERNYFNQQQRFVGPFIIHDFGDVGYMHYRSFNEFVEDSNMEYILSEFENHKGLIIDMRNNGGGSLSNVYQIAKFFNPDADRVFAQQRRKNGPGRDDYSSFEDLTINSNNEVFTKPIVVITNRNCYSACSFFTAAMLSLPQVYIIGDTTGGGGGVPSSTILSNGWSLRVSNTQTILPNGFNIENGIPPNERVDMLPENVAEGVDPILERALEYIRN